jgi:hypothetical protein
MKFERTPDDKWIFNQGKTHLKHDVRAMSSFESEQVRFVVSGGPSHPFPCKSDFKVSTEVYPFYRSEIRGIIYESSLPHRKSRLLP